MCGLIALLGKPSSTLALETLQLGLTHMHRPDAEGTWHESGVCLGHRRLAILDLDIRSNQPLHSACGRYVIVFNGEIYNYRALRAELASAVVPLHTTSDTEGIVELFTCAGEAMLPHLRGMFAFVIWDRVARRAFAARDPYGIKPLYWAQTADGVLLASQVQALLATGKVSRAPCAQGPAGYCAWIDGGRMGAPQCWRDVAAAWRDVPAALPSAAEVRDRVRVALSASVAVHFVADVSVGVFLSGGIDSGSLAGLMVDASAKNLEGITVAFHEYADTHNDEVLFAARLTEHYGITHHVRHVAQKKFMDDMPSIPAAMDQPSVDGTNTWYATKAVAELGLKVVVSGVGGDELFQGYGHFQTLPCLVSAWGSLSCVPGVIPLARAAMGWQARRTGNARWHHLPDWASTMSGAWWLRRGWCALSELPALMGPELAAEGLAGFSPDAWVGQMSGDLAADSRLAIGQIESTTYMRNQLLRDSDWVSMDHSVELRTPFVDAWLLRDVQPLLGAFSQFPNKRLLAEAPIRPLPEVLINRPKRGFGIPVQTWLNQMGVAGDGGPSHSWAREVAAQHARQLTGPTRL